MKKLRLNVDALQVESFDVTAARESRGTVGGAEYAPLQPPMLDTRNDATCTGDDTGPWSDSNNTYCPNVTCTYTNADWTCITAVSCYSCLVTCGVRCVPGSQFQSCEATCTIG
jgi:hypothetical protein